MNQFLRYILFLLITINTAFAFNTTGKISGRIKDTNTGEPLPFVNVIIEGTTLGAASDVDGYYTIVNVSPGTYSLKASAIGYNAVTVQNVKVSIGLTTNIDFNLSEASTVKADVVVVAEKPLIQKDLTASTSIVNSDVISALPVTDLGDILQLQAGVVTSSDGQIHMRGGRSGQVAYQIDGVPVTDAYDNSNVIDVATNSIQELQVVSGAFNAEFGQAMSGIVNIVTKDGGNEFSGNFQTYTGDYISNKTSKFWNIEKVNPTAIRDFEGSLSGPIIPNQLFFFTNGRYYYNEGHLYGKRVFLPTDVAAEVAGSGGSDFTIVPHGDGAFVPMNPDERIFAQGKLTDRLFTGFKISYNLIFDKEKYKEYNNDNRLRLLTPDNNLQRFRKGYTNTLAINHAVSQKSFYNLNLSYFFKDYRHYLYKDINTTGDPNHLTDYVNNFITQTPPYSFEVGGTDYARFSRNTSTYAAKLDWTTQLNREINVQFGGEFRQHRIYFHDITIFPNYNENGKLFMQVPPLTSPDNDEYLHWPQEGSFYVQSKFEAYSLIFNVGVRYDIFNPDGKILSDPTDPNINSPLKPANRFNDLNNDGTFEPALGETEKTLADREQYWYKKAKIKSQISPRLGIAFPISDKGVIHFSYGHFLQLPSYDKLYENPEFELGVGSGNQGLFGNADLKPQKTVKGEIGLQQQIGENLSVDLTLFFEDFRNLTGTQQDEIVVYGKGSSYSQYANSDFGSSKGFIIKVDQRLSDGLALSLDYTFSVTKGNASNPADARDAITRGQLPETFIAPLNWDQPHTLNLSVSYAQPRNFGVSLIGNMYSGQPFTPAVNKNTNVTQNGFPTNSQYKPTIFNIDMRAYKDFPIGNATITIFAKVFNLFDLDNPVNVYDNSGDPSFTFDKLDAQKTNPKTYYNTLDQYYTNPFFFSQPRRVEAGLSFNF